MEKKNKKLITFSFSMKEMWIEKCKSKLFNCNLIEEIFGNFWKWTFGHNFAEVDEKLCLPIEVTQKTRIQYSHEAECWTNYSDACTIVETMHGSLLSIFQYIFASCFHLSFKTVESLRNAYATNIYPRCGKICGNGRSILSRVKRWIGFSIRIARALRFVEMDNDKVERFLIRISMNYDEQL